MPVYPRQTKNKGQVYDVVVRHGERSVWKRGFSTQREAKRHEAKLRTDLNEGRYASEGNMTLLRFWEEEWRPTKATRLKPWSLRTVSGQLKPALDFLGGKRLDKITAGDVQGVITHCREKGLSATTAQLCYTRLKDLLNGALRRGYVYRNVADLVDRPPADYHLPPIMDVAEVRRLLNVAGETRYGTMVQLAVVTGMRRGELLGAKWADLDTEAGVLRIPRAKTRAGIRTVALGPEVLEMLRQHRLGQMRDKLAFGPDWPDTDLIFVSEVGTPIRPANLFRVWERIRDKAELPSLHFHDLRHLSATLLVRLGVHPRIAADRLGHADTATTMQIYSHVGTDDQREAAVGIERLLAANS